jgi:glycosyltransferase involved in cell wall biosynthesis
MKVAIDLKLMVQSQTGIAAFTNNLLIDIQNAKYSDIEIYLLFPEGTMMNVETIGKMKCLNVEKTHFKNSMINHFMYDQYSILRTLNKLKPDVFYVPYFDIPYFYNGKLITSIHDMTMYNQRYFYPKRQQLYYGMLMKKAIERSTFIVTISNVSKREICETFSYPAENVFVYYIRPKKGFLTNNHSNEKLEQVRNKYSLPTDFILYTGGVDPRKNINGLIRSYRELESMKGTVPTLVITGSSHEYSIQLLKSLGVNKENDSVLLPGYIDESDLPAVYSLSLFTVYPSVNEGFGIPLVESMASGKAVCCPDIELFHEIAGDAPLFYDRKNNGALTEAMLLLLTDNTLRKKKEKDGLDNAELYKNINHAQTFINLLRQALIK